jgi:hypothetical protein
MGTGATPAYSLGFPCHGLSGLMLDRAGYRVEAGPVIKDGASLVIASPAARNDDSHYRVILDRPKA